MPHPTDTIYQSCNQWASPQKELLYDTVINLNAQSILEIGTNVGDSTRLFSAALKETSGHLYSVDKKEFRDGWYLKRETSNITFIIEDSLTLPWDKALDLLLINGGHEYETALSDLTRFSPFVRPGGQILVHDTVLVPDVMKALQEWSVKAQSAYVQYPHGVGLAVITV